MELLQTKRMDCRTKVKTATKSSLAKVAVQYSTDTFVVNQSLVLRINICSENRQLLVAAKRYRNLKQSSDRSDRPKNKKRFFKKGGLRLFPN